MAAPSCPDCGADLRSFEPHGRLCSQHPANRQPPLTTFNELAVDDRFVFHGQPDAGIPRRVCVKTGAREFEVEDDGTPGRVGCGENPVRKVAR